MAFTPKMSTGKWEPDDSPVVIAPYVEPKLRPGWEEPPKKKGLLSSLFGFIKKSAKLSDVGKVVKGVKERIETGKPLIEPQVTIKSLDFGMQPVYLIALVVVAWLVLQRK